MEKLHDLGNLANIPNLFKDVMQINMEDINKKQAPQGSHGNGTSTRELMFYKASLDD